MINLEILKKAYKDARKHQSSRTFAELAYWTNQYEIIARSAILELENAQPKQARLDSTGAAAVDHNYFWQPITTCPMGVKVQLLGAGGVAMYGTYNGKEKFYTHWAPLPKLAKG